MRTYLIPITLLCTLLAGCTLEEKKDTSATAAPVVSVPALPAPTEPKMQAGGPGGMMPQGTDKPAPPMGMPPMAGGGGVTAPLTPTPDLDKKIASAEKGKGKKAIAVAYAARGTFRMNDQDAGAKVKYRAALDDYRKALAADPTNTEASGNKAQIEAIYKQMGRPIPGEEATITPAK